MPARDRFRALDAWRGLCALMIALLHFCIQEWPVRQWLCSLPVVSNAWLFVDFFFVLSGFVIGHAYGDRLGGSVGMAVFALRRFGRLWPLHAATLVMLAAVRLLAPVLTTGQPGPLPLTGRQSVLSFGLDLLLLRGVGLAAIEPAFHLDWNYPSWSIGAELYGCLIFASLCVWVRRRALLHAVEAAVIVASACVLALAVGHMDATDDYGLFRCLYGFLLGRLLYEVFRLRRAERLTAASALEVAVTGGVVSFVATVDHSVATLAAPLLFAAAIYVFAHEQGVLSRLLQARAPQRAGELSYSIYMVHVLVYEVMLRVLYPGVRWFGRSAGIGNPVDVVGEPLAAAVLLVVAMAAVVAAASCTHAWIEQPGRRWFNALASRYARAS